VYCVENVFCWGGIRRMWCIVLRNCSVGMLFHPVPAQIIYVHLCHLCMYHLYGCICMSIIASIRWELVLLEWYSVPFLHKLSTHLYRLWMCYPYIHEMRTCSLRMVFHTVHAQLLRWFVLCIYQMRTCSVGIVFCAVSAQIIYTDV